MKRITSTLLPLLVVLTQACDSASEPEADTQADTNETVSDTTPDTREPSDTSPTPSDTATLPPDTDGPDGTISDTASNDTGPADTTPPDTSPDTTLADTSSDTTTDTVSGCTPGERRCDGDDAQVCSASRAFVLAEACAYGCTDGVCDAPACAAGELACDGDDVVQCRADRRGFNLFQACEFGCIDNRCASAPNAILIEPLGVDIIALGQTVPFRAIALDEEGHELDDIPVTWSISNGTLASVSPTSPTTASVKGLAIGGGDAQAPTGSLVLSVEARGVRATRPLQVVQLSQGTGLTFLPTDSGGSTDSNGNDRYDGVYPTTLSPASSQCNPYSAANTQGCTWKQAEARLFVGDSLEVRARGAGRWGEFGIGLLEHPAQSDGGVIVSPTTPRALHIEWGSSNPAVAVVDGGFVTALASGRTEISARLGPQTWTLDLLVYDRFGYDPVADFAPGVTPEGNHLVLFSSSAGMAIDGTLDTVRYVDLSNYENLDFRPSRLGPQGVRLVETINGTRERHTGYGCGFIKGAGDVIWLLNGWTAVPFDTKRAIQVGNLNTVEFRPEGVASGGNAVCSGVYVELGGRAYLVGFDARPNGVSAYVADVTNIEDGNVTSKPVSDALFNQVPPVEFYAPTLWYEDGEPLILFAEQTPRNNPALPNKLRVATLSRLGTDLIVTVDLARTISTAPTPNAADNQNEAPGLRVAQVDGREFVLFGNRDTITVIDTSTWAIVNYSGTGSTDPLLRDLDTRRFGANIRAFSLSPDGETLAFLPETSYPDAPHFNTRVEWRANGTTQGTNMTVHRLGLIDLTGDAQGRPRLMVAATDPRDCYRLSACTDEQWEYGYDLNLLSLKQWMLGTGLAPSTGAILPPQAMNIRQVAFGDEAIFLIGNDAPDGAGTALGNMSDIAVIHLATGRMAAFRGWRSDPSRLVGLSDPFGLRVGEGDAVLGNVRTKHAGILWVEGPPPEARAGDGEPRLPDVAMGPTKVYAAAPLPEAETGEVLLLSSSHLEAVDGTHDVVRSVGLSGDRWAEADFDPNLDGAQGAELTYVVAGTLIKWRGGCGSVTGPDGRLWLFNGDSAVVFDPDVMRQGANGHQVTFDPDPANASMRICSGTFITQNGRTWLIGVNVDLRPNPLVVVAEVTDIDLASVDASPVTSPFFAPNPAADPYFVRYVSAVTVDDEVWFLEENDPWNAMRNTVHRAIFDNGTLSFDLTRSSDIVAGYTLDGDPGLALVDTAVSRLLFVGNQNSISIFDVTDPEVPARFNFNVDGDGVQDDLETSWYGRGIQGFATSPDGQRVFALPSRKSAALPRERFRVTTGGGGYGYVSADRYRMAAISLFDPSAPRIDPNVNQGNGIDLNYWWFKQWILDHFGQTPLPPMFPSFRRQFAASNHSVFLIGADADGGAGSALANAVDVATYDIATGRGHLWRGYRYEGLSNAGGYWGYDLGVGADGLDDEQLEGARAKNAAVVFLP